jgi:cellulose synthase/poly-beta-1,6-N-acetylglucosamine synthase-like glycosyltransferase
MFFFVIAWLLFGFLSLGPAAFIFYYMKNKSKRSWPTKVDSNYKPRISVIVPTYNESSIILFKLINLSRLRYPKDLMEIVIVDSNSSDDTAEIVRQFSQKEPQVSIKVLVEKERRGKSHALNYALNHCNGDVIIVSDADCFWPSDILEKAMPFLADSSVGAIAGPKILLNPNQTWVTRMEEGYLKSANVLRLGESKVGSTVFFEGGFSAFKREAFDRFDPYGTGSDDCGTVIRVIQKNFRTMLVPEAKFYSTFPASFRGKLGIKLRRINQLVRVFAKYLDLLVQRKLKATKRTVVPNTLLYLFSPIALIVFILLTVFLVFSFPFLLLFFGLLIIPEIRFYFYEIFESNMLLIAAIFGIMLGKEFSIWSQPEDRRLLTKDTLRQFNLI